MKSITHRIWLAAPLALASTLACAQAPVAPAATVDQFHRAIAEGDRASATRALAASVLIFESGYVERSRDEYLSHHFDSDVKFAKSVKRKVTRQDEQVAGDVAIVTAETESNGTYEGKPIGLIGIETAVLRLVDGRWQIVHVHWSSRKATR